MLLSDEAEEGRLLQSETDWNRWSVILPQKVPVDSMVATGNGVFVAFNEEGAWTSADGATWQSAYLMPEASSLGVVEYAGGRFVAGGSAAIILTSHQRRGLGPGSGCARKWARAGLNLGLCDRVR
ncbi:MAG: hypothetical protein KatS3mg060_1115 [Dehalococcoidia bacterium]|nr:MAG: hypothetical protein KatS3mg060_1115 [Dehalococcoidia bacterium]